MAMSRHQRPHPLASEGGSQMNTSAQERGAVVMTGASSGIGEASALLLARAGFHVFAGVRREEDARALAGRATGRLTPLLLDITDSTQIRSAAETVAERVGGRGLAGLVNNAGVGVAWPLEVVPLDEFRRQFEVNVFGHLAVTQAFLPLLRAATGRIVNVGSVGGRVTIPLSGTPRAPRDAFVAGEHAVRHGACPPG